MDEQHAEGHYVEVERRGEAAVVTLSRPEVMNAFCVAMTTQLLDVLRDLDDGATRVIVLTGAGPRAFSAGADLREMLDMDLAAARRSLDAGIAVTRQLERTGATTIAAINGAALGGGTEIALACDLRIAGQRAKLGLPEVSVGIFPGWGGAVRLPRLIPRGLALELILTGRAVDAAEALRIGLVNAVVEDALGAALELTERLLAQAPVAQRQAKLVAQRSGDMALDDAMAFANEAWLQTFFTSDRAEGHRAFLERRSPTWTGA